MQKSSAINEAWPANLRTPEAADYVGISVSKITKLRMAANRRDSPPFVKVAGCVIYRRKDLDEWLERNVVRSDADDGWGLVGVSDPLSTKPVPSTARPGRARRPLGKK
jgi:predicted DNA-binding transcriptional regulator AlpA